MPFSEVEEAVAAIGRGGMAVVVDDEDRENEGDLVMAAEAATPETIAFFLAHTSGVICVPLMPERADRLDLPLMVSANTEAQRTAFTVSVDARSTTTGISAADRAATIAALIDPATRPADLNRPGHIFPLRYRPGGVLKRAGHTEATVDLARAAGLSPAGVLCEIVTEDKSAMARLPELERFAERHGLPLISIAELIRYRRRTEKLVRRVSEARIPTGQGAFSAYVYESVLDGEQHLALVMGDVDGGRRPGAGALRVPDRRRLRLAALRLRAPAPRRRRPHRGGGPGRPRLPAGPRGPGHRPRATRSAPTASKRTATTPSTPTWPRACRSTAGSTASGRRCWWTSGVTTMRLMTNNPSKYGGLEGFGLDIVERVPLAPSPNPENIEYLRTKRERMGHLLDGLDDVL